MSKSELFARGLAIASLAEPTLSSAMGAELHAARSRPAEKASPPTEYRALMFSPPNLGAVGVGVALRCGLSKGA